MVLEKYKQKRNFSSTPEPAGDVKLAAERAKSAKPEKGLFFCVQKHLASHLHYDFRLEHNGVLLSWAVPKGPSLDPKTKRLAMHVEDHPFEYGTFEGVIPSGYGAGIVMLWDQGTWKPESEDVDAALKKGDLKFTLDGYKLKGSWVLVRTGGATAAARRRLAQLAADQAPRRLGGRRRHHRVRAAQRQERRRFRGHPRRRQARTSGSRTARPKAARPARCCAKIIERAAALKAGRGTAASEVVSPGRGASREQAPQRERQGPGRTKTAGQTVKTAEGQRSRARRKSAGTPIADKESTRMKKQT